MRIHYLAIHKTTKIGKLYSFNSRTTSITAYQEQVDLYFLANEIDDGLRTAVLLTFVGSSTYELLHYLLAPVSPKDKSYDGNSVFSHFSPKPLSIAECFHFYRRTREEPVAMYKAELHRLSLRCRLGVHFDLALHDRLVCGLWNESTLRSLLG